ncbi:hypothetical protein HPP92_015758 [Vanilla planifolia]|uniref:Uncharacterized protein n=1 Tax=Vanilla planifolia TaxID=51239 RepID=A0A835QLS8_VANPL|nr:hypothetical protein HPP92_015758 [Vanilla planifolia]
MSVVCSCFCAGINCFEITFRFEMDRKQEESNPDSFFANLDCGDLFVQFLGQQWGTSFGLGWQSFLGGLVCYGGVVLTEFSKSELHMVRKLKRVAHIILDFNSKEY